MGREHYPRSQADLARAELLHELLDFVRQPNRVAKYDNAILREREFPDVLPFFIEDYKLHPFLGIFPYKALEALLRHKDADAHLCLLVQAELTAAAQCIFNINRNRALVVPHALHVGPAEGYHLWPVRRHLEHGMKNNVPAHVIRYPDAVRDRRAYGIHLALLRQAFHLEIRLRHRLAGAHDEDPHG